jgi:alpha-mannosidase
VSDDHCGLTIANRGLPEYEVLRDGANTIALTLLRCVGQIGDWGDFPTPEAQCLGEQRAAYAIIPHGGRISHPGPDGPAAIAYGFAYPMWGMQVASRGDAIARSDGRPRPSALPASASLVSLDPANVVLSAVKKAEDRDSLIVRVYNPFGTAQEVALECAWPIAEAHLVNLAEERGEALEAAEGRISLTVGAKKIVTVELVVG